MVPSNFFRRGGWAVLTAALAAWLATGAAAQDKWHGPVKVTVEAEKDQRSEAGGGPVDPAQRIRFQALGQTFNLFLMDDMGRRLHLNQMASVKMDGTAFVPGPAAGGLGKWEVLNAPLPKKAGKERVGYMKVWSRNDLRITQTVELTPSKTVVDGKRRLDSALVRYTLENTGSAPHTVGLRTAIDTYLVNQRNCKFAAPNRPGKLLDGLEFKGNDVPGYVQTLQLPDLKNPGAMTHLTLALGAGVERPDRVVLTSALGRRDLWDLQVMAGGGISLLGFFWEPKEIKPGGKRELAYAYGVGLAAPLSPDANFQIQLGGSFEKGKLFTIAALISDPGEGQSLELELPKGLERVEGKLIQPVPAAEGDTASSMVLWKGRLLDYGQYPIRIRSNAGVTKTVKLTVGPG